MTPGPWRIVSDPMHFDSLTTVEAGNMVVQVGGLKSNLKEMEANTRLIAAAPELLETLEQSLKVVDAYRRMSGGDGDITAMCIRDVIAKAKGEPTCNSPE